MELRQLLALYYEGGTTLGQERRLRELLAGGGTPDTPGTPDTHGLPADLRHEAAMFGFFAAAAAEKMRKETGIACECIPSPTGTAESAAAEQVQTVEAVADRIAEQARTMEMVAEPTQAPGAAVDGVRPTDTPGAVANPDATADAQERTPARLRSRRRLGLLGSFVSAAAIVAVAVTMTLKTDGGDMPQVYCYVDGRPVTDIELASRQAEMVVRILEGNMRVSVSGLEAAEKAGVPIERMSMEPGGAQRTEQ